MIKKKAKRLPSIERMRRSLCVKTLCCFAIVVLTMVIFPGKIECAHVLVQNIINVVSLLAISYIAAYIFYCHSEIALDRLQHDKQKWFIYDNLYNLIGLIQTLLTNQKWDKQYDESDAKGYLSTTSYIHELRRDCQQVLLKTIQLTSQTWKWNDEDFVCLSQIYSACKQIDNLIMYDQVNNYREIAELFNCLNESQLVLNECAAHHIL